MTWSLRGDPDAVATLAARIEDATAIPSAHVEKDFWVTEVLRGVAHESAETGVSAVFKGGTSLSKAYRLIARFSEDVDVIVITPGVSTNNDDRCLKRFVASAAAATGLEGEVDPSTATKGLKRTATFRYPAGASPGPLRPGVMLELGARGGTMPTVLHQVTSLIVEHADVVGLAPDFAESKPVELHVLAPVRTLIEKLTILHHAATVGDSAEQARLARHYYDVWCLLGDEDTVAELAISPADVLAREVVTFTEAAGLETSKRPSSGFADSPAFNADANESARTAFNDVVLDQLLWPKAPRPTFQECCAAVQDNSQLL